MRNDIDTPIRTRSNCSAFGNWIFAPILFLAAGLCIYEAYSTLDISQPNIADIIEK